MTYYFHVYIKPSSERGEYIYIDVAEKDIKNFVRKYRNDGKVFINNKCYDLTCLKEIYIFKTIKDSKKLTEEHFQNIAKMSANSGILILSSGMGLLGDKYDVTNQYIKETPGQGTRLKKILYNKLVLLIFGPIIGSIVTLIIQWLAKRYFF